MRVGIDILNEIGAYALLPRRLDGVARTGTISEAARILGCTREHLRRVLNGHRSSRSLTARYEALKTRQAKEGV
jgi:DNA-binding phage protein